MGEAMVSKIPMEVGAALVIMGAKQWMFILGAASTIHASGVNRADSALLYLVYILAAELLLLWRLPPESPGRWHWYGEPGPGSRHMPAKS
jgi:hypothetical protein